MIGLLVLTLIFGHACCNVGSRTSAYASENSRHLSKVSVWRGGNATLPCRFNRNSGDFSVHGEMRIRWAKVSSDSNEVEVLVSMGIHKNSFNGYNGRVYLRERDEDDASLVITDVTLDDEGTYKCEVIDGMEDAVELVTLELQGVVFPYAPRLGRYNLNFHDAVKACREQDAVVASLHQLFRAWNDGLNWCNAGWLSDGTVQYPITFPRDPCGGRGVPPGVRNYGLRNKSSSHYDVFCFTSKFKGHFYYLAHPTKLTYNEAVQACRHNGAEIAKTGQIHAAWKLEGFDRCDAGWLEDGSVRYPIAKPRRNCSPNESAVRFVGFPDKKQKLYGVYCFRAVN